MTEQAVTQHPPLLKTLSLECPNSICLLESPYPIERYTCLMHAFGFTGKPKYIEIATYGDGQVFASPEFAHWLIDRDLLIEVPQAGARSGNLVMYFNNCHFKHIGVLVDHGRVESKWGIGHFYMHELMEVPESYGTEVRFFRRLQYDVAYNYLKRFAKEKGISFYDSDK